MRHGKNQMRLFCGVIRLVCEAPRIQAGHGIVSRDLPATELSVGRSLGTSRFVGSKRDNPLYKGFSRSRPNTED